MPLLRLFTEASVVYRSICCNRILQIFAEAASAEASVKRFGRSFCRSTLRSITGSTIGCSFLCMQEKEIAACGLLQKWKFILKK